MDADAPAPEPVTPPRATLPLPTDDLRPASEGGPRTPEREARTPAEPVVARGLVPQQLLDPDAVSVVRRLQRNGQEAYVVGGCVRDLLAGLEPKDFDVATDAHPSRIKRLFHGARVIGRRFRLVHIRFPGEHVIETSTFRGDPERLAREAEAAGESVDAWMERHGAENFFGTAPEDARRRDFTINALFYDPLRDEVIDWVGGLRDLEQRVVRSIGDPDRRLGEDPVRMIRAVHFAERLGFSIEPELLAAIERNAARIADASQARLYVELQKVVSRGRARNSFHRLWELRVLEAWIPELSGWLDRPMAWPQEAGGTHAEASHGEPSDLPAAHATWNLLAAADRWGLAARRAPESLQMAVLFGSWLLETWRMEREEGRGADFFPSFAEHMERVFRPVALRMSIPRWVSARLTDVLWMLLELRSPPQPRRRRTFARAGFSEALALLEMDLAARDAGPELLEQWIAAAEDAGANLELAATGQARAETLDQLPPDQRRRRRGGRSRRPRRGFADTPEPAPGEPHSGLRAEADAWAPAPEADEDPPPPYDAGPAPSPPVAPPPPAPRPTSAPPPAPPPREVPREIPRPRSPLADDDFASGIL